MTLGTGVHLGIPAQVYHADPCIVPSLSSSIAQVLLRESPYKAWFSHPRLNKGYSEDRADKFDLGTAAHAMLLEDNESAMAVVDADDWRTKAAQAQRDAARAAGKTPILAGHFQKVLEMVAAAKAFIPTSEIGSAWKAADSEVTAVIQESGTWLRCRFDRATKDRRVIMDYKTTEDASPETFSRQIPRMGYHLQDAFYRRIARTLNGATVPEPIFAFLVQSVTPPYECSLAGCDPTLQEIADYEVGRAIQLWRDCIKADKWPSYGGRIHWTIPTIWQIKQHEERLQEAA